jgi:hypothetical protein
MSAGGGDKKSPLSTIDKPDIKKHNTRNEIASDLGWSTGKVAMADVQGRRCQMLPSYDPEKPLKKPSIRAN